MVAYMLAFSRSILGDGVLGIRFFPLIVSLLVPFLFVRALEDKSAGILYAIFWASPILQIVLFFMTPDVPFLLFSSLFLYYYIKKRSPDLIGGILLGLALLSKYMAFLLYPALFFDIKRRDIKRFILFFILVPFIIFLPVIIFNILHGFVSFKYQFAHGTGGFNIRPRYFIKYLVDILIASGIPLSIYGMFGLLKRKWDKNKITLLTGWVFFLFFLFFSFFSRIEANWPILFYPPLLYAGYRFIEGFKYRGHIICMYFLLSLPLKPILLIPQIKYRVFKKEIAMKDIARRLKDAKLPVFANTYQHASLLSYYLKRYVPSLNIKSRHNQFDLWKKTYPHEDFIFVGIGYKDVMSHFYVDSTLYKRDNISVYKVRFK